jgi:two-component system, sensor histidine kinase PdtaS
VEVPGGGAAGGGARPTLPAVLARLPWWLPGVGSTGLALLVVLATFVAVAAANREAALETARQRAAGVATTLGEHAGRLLDATELALAEVAEIPDGRDWAELAGSTADHLRLKRLAGRLDYVSAFWLTDETGMPRLTSRSYPAPAIKTSDREYFVRAKEGASGPLLSTLLRSRVTGETNIVLAERVADEKSDFRGTTSLTAAPARKSCSRARTRPWCCATRGCRTSWR